MHTYYCIQYPQWCSCQMLRGKTPKQIKTTTTHIKQRGKEKIRTTPMAGKDIQTNTYQQFIKH